MSYDNYIVKGNDVYDGSRKSVTLKLHERIQHR